MTFQELENNIGNELYYLAEDNLPNDLTGYVPPKAVLTHTRVIRASDGAGSNVTRFAVIGDRTTTTDLVFLTLPEAYTGLAGLYNQLRADSAQDVIKYRNLRDEAQALAGG